MLKAQHCSLSERDVDLFLRLIKRKKGIDLSLYSKNFLARRLRNRISATGVNNLPEYIGELENNDTEWNCFLDNLSINISEFYRDPKVYAYLEKYCIPGVIAEKKRKGQKFIRVWSCGCSYGEEPYSLTIMLNDFLARKRENFLVRVWGSDIDKDALEKAKQGIFPLSAFKKMNELFLERYFELLSSGKYCVRDLIKKQVIFLSHDLASDLPLPNMDIIFFRNVKIYFDKEKNIAILLSLYNALKSGGYLVLGSSETIDGSARDLFEEVSLACRIYKKK